MTALGGASAVVIGAGRSGRAAARLLAGLGTRVTVLETRRDVEPDPTWPAGVNFRTGADDPGDLAAFDFVVPSPGVARDHPVLRRAVERGVPVWSEIELASRFLSCPILAVTGTNGKSTTTVLLGAILAAEGRKVFVGGNLGTPLCDAIGDGCAYEAAVAEVSSFQLEWVPSFRPRVAVLLNLTPDHQDRYASMREYGEAKAAILAHQESDDIAILNRDDPWVWEQRRRTRATVVSFGREPVEFGTYLDGDEVVVYTRGAPQRYPLAESPLRGAHNRENIQAAVTAAAAVGVSSTAVHRALRQTSGLPHRLEFVREHRGVRYFDDSKATNVGAVEKSIASFAEGILLLLGGYDKGGDFGVLSRHLGRPVDEVIYFGAAGPQLAAQLQPAGGATIAPTLARAVELAAERARPGQVVLLAPGCASFDEFSDYAARGRHFRSLVEALGER
jgi:UDP-N-acetylmuramoylalanine--D-glutamate ligase